MSSQWKYCAVSSTVDSDNNPRLKPLKYSYCPEPPLLIRNYAVAGIANVNCQCSCTGFGTLRTNFSDILKGASASEISDGLSAVKLNKKLSFINNNEKKDKTQKVKELGRGFINKKTVDSALYAATSKKIAKIAAEERDSVPQNGYISENIDESVNDSITISDSAHAETAGEIGSINDKLISDIDKKAAEEFEERLYRLENPEVRPKEILVKTVTYTTRENAVATFLDQHHKRFNGGKPVLFTIRKNCKNCLASYGEDENKLINNEFHRIKNNPSLDSLKYLNSIYFNCK